MPIAPRRLHARARGFTLVEAMALAAVVGAALAGAVAAQPKGRTAARQLKDATQIRGIGQALMIFAQQNRERYVLPGLIDRNGATVKGSPESKGTTANIFSVLVWNGAISPELCVSPLENNPRIKADDDYQSSQPKAAVNPPEALWDPAFSADFTEGRTGNVSYAHLMPQGQRLERWSNTFNSAEAVISNRGPEITAVEYLPEDLARPTYANADSNTFTFYAPGAWSGNVLFNDAHVEFIEDYLKPGGTVDTAARYKDKEGRPKPDMAFYQEPDDAADANNFMGVFVTAGAKAADFKSIWD